MVAGPLPPNPCALGTASLTDGLLQATSFLRPFAAADLGGCVDLNWRTRYARPPSFMAGALGCPNARISRLKSGAIESTDFADETQRRQAAPC